MKISEGNRVLWLDPETEKEHKATVQRVFKQKARIQLGDFSERSVYLGELTLAPLPYKTIGEVMRERAVSDRVTDSGETVREQPLFPNNCEGETVREQPLLPNNCEGETVREQPLLPNNGEGETVREQPLLPNNGEGETVREQPLLPNNGEGETVREQPLFRELGEGETVREQPLFPNNCDRFLQSASIDELNQLSAAIFKEISRRQERTDIRWIEEKFITRNGKKHGPYLYERWRENGRLKSRYIGLKPVNSENNP